MSVQGRRTGLFAVCRGRLGFDEPISPRTWRVYAAYLVGSPGMDFPVAWCREHAAYINILEIWRTGFYWFSCFGFACCRGWIFQ